MTKKKNKRLPKPTTAELLLLQVLWEHGALTVRQIHEAVDGNTVYSSTLKLMQRMVEKGLVIRDESQRSHVYQAADQAEVMQKSLVQDLLRNAFGGKPGQLVIQALSEQKATPEELKEIRQLLDAMESRRPSPGSKTKGKTK